MELKKNYLAIGLNTGDVFFTGKNENSVIRQINKCFPNPRRGAKKIPCYRNRLGWLNWIRKWIDKCTNKTVKYFVLLAISEVSIVKYNLEMVAT